MKPKLLAPVEFYWLPSLLGLWWERRDGEILEGVEELRKEVNVRFRGRVLNQLAG